eukprot:gnl/MRDRNA2_/MRDRNA2_95118_c0_seq1.p1 gnl/MRDRNA2_/MRDRNA2_95118_c0~~gnl/MRDRNA2_/MRDRNA2_95118_c0_seq1.p1  ORF type:complete len:272 (+),score=23.14 gnl/MRDRNA2_/MRDRNA2_95118_c0_seq1:116-817(+)
MSAHPVAATSTQHEFWQQSVAVEERLAGKHWPINTWPHRDGGHAEAKFNCNPHLEKYYARGFPHEINNSSRGVTDCLSETAPDFAKTWSTTTRHTAQVPFRSTEPAMSGEHIHTNINTSARLPDHPLSRPHMNRSGEQKTVPRVRRSREVPWGPPEPFRGPPMKTGLGRAYTHRPQGGPLKHGRLAMGMAEAMRSGEIQKKSLSRLTQSARMQMSSTHSGTSNFQYQDQEPLY